MQFIDIFLKFVQEDFRPIVDLVLVLAVAARVADCWQRYANPFYWATCSVEGPADWG